MIAQKKRLSQNSSFRLINGKTLFRFVHHVLASRSSRGHFLLAGSFRVTHDELSERGTTRTLVNGFLTR